MEKIIFLGYLALISLIAMVVTIYDKIASKHATKHRIRESTLLLISLLGGAVPMYITMQLIRHKTRHAKFMLGIPLIMLLHIALVLVAYKFILPVI